MRDRLPLTNNRTSKGKHELIADVAESIRHLFSIYFFDSKCAQYINKQERNYWSESSLKGLFHPACLAHIVSWFAFVVTIFMGHENGY